MTLLPWPRLGWFGSASRVRRDFRPRVDGLEPKIAPGSLVATTTTTLKTSLLSMYQDIGQPIALMATVTNTPGNVGTVDFLDGSDSLGTMTPTADPSGSGSSLATLTVSNLALGTHSLTAMFSGAQVQSPGNPTSSIGYTASTSAAVSVTVVPTRGTTQSYVGQDNASPLFDSSINLYAVVAPNTSDSTYTGGVAFYDGSTLIGTTNVTTVPGQTYAVLPTSTLGVGSHQVTAQFLGDATHAPSVSDPTTIRVSTNSATDAGQDNATLTSPNDRPTLYAVVANRNQGGPAPTGSVVFLDGSNVLGSASLITVPGQTYTSLQISATDIAPSYHTITMYYAGDSFNAPSAATTHLFRSFS